MRLGPAGSVGAEGEEQDERMDSPNAPGVCAVFLLPVLRMVPRCDDRPGPNRRAENTFATGLEEAAYAARPPAVGTPAERPNASLAERLLTDGWRARGSGTGEYVEVNMSLRMAAGRK